MSVLQAVAIGAVAVGGTVVALLTDPLRQTLALGLYGIALTLMFFTLQAPDVALSELVISTVALPVIVLAALRRIRRHEREREGGEQ